MHLLRKLLADESGATAIEYGLIAALVSVVIMTTLGLLGGSLDTTFVAVKDELAGAGGGGAAP
jgi:pilus assembly protein Flp/PilA